MESVSNLVAAGDELVHAGDFAAALERFEQAALVAPEALELKLRLANCLFQIPRLEESLAAYHEILQAADIEPSLRENIGIRCGVIYRQLGRLPEAIEAYHNVLSQFPASVGAHLSLCVALQRTERDEEAERCARAAIVLAPDNHDAHVALAYSLLAQGKLLEGWGEYQWRLQAPGCAVRNFPKPMWASQSLEGKTIFIHSEQGFGDTFQFMRYLPVVRGLGASVIFGAQRPLVRFLSSQPVVDQLVREASWIPAFDYHCPLLSLPHILKTTVETIPRDSPYLSADPQLEQQWGQQLAGDPRGQLKIGICGTVRATADDARYRSIPRQHFEQLSRLVDTKLISLEKSTPGQPSEIDATPWLTRIGPKLDAAGAFCDTAAVIKNLDLVITADTSIAHLAGALGIPVWIALSVGCDWRWLRGRADSVWYPTAKLFRQTTLGNWDDVFAQISVDLQQFARQRQRQS